MTGDIEYGYGNSIPMDDLNEMSKEVNKLYSTYLDNKVLARLTTTTSSTSLFPKTGSIVQWTKYPIVPGNPHAAVEAEIINFKLFKIKADKFCALYPQWRVVPDANAPLQRIVIEHEGGTLKIVNKFPSNEVEMVGADKQIQIGMGDIFKPLDQIGLKFPIHNMHIFERWAFGMEDCPYGK